MQHVCLLCGADGGSSLNRSTVAYTFGHGIVPGTMKVCMGRQQRQLQGQQQGQQKQQGEQQGSSRAAAGSSHLVAL
jgi:hypothetical protein